MTRGMTRRAAIRVGASVLVASALHLDSTTDTAAVGRDAAGGILNGTIRSLKLPSEIVIETPAGSRNVRFGPSATFNRSGPARLSDFRVGDRVVVESVAHGAPSSLGRRLEVRYGHLAGLVIAVRASGLLTTAGPVAVTRDTIVHEVGNLLKRLPLSDLRNGTAVMITTQFDPSSQTYVALRIGVTR